MESTTSTTPEPESPEPESTEPGAEAAGGGFLGGLESPVVREEQADLFLSTFERDPLVKMLTTKGVHPDDVHTLARWAPLGLTHLLWRNSVLEDWHGGPDSTISDGGMFMGNVSTTRMFDWTIRDMLDGWELDRFACLDDVADIDADSFMAYLVETVDEVVDPERVLPHGVNLFEVGGPDVDELREHAMTQSWALYGAVDKRGADVVLLWLAVRGLYACEGWWGGTQWPHRVDRFLGLLDDPTHEQWRGQHPGTPPSPAQDRTWLRHTLLVEPDALGIEVADWLIHRALIGYVSAPDL